MKLKKLQYSLYLSKRSKFRSIFRKCRKVPLSIFEGVGVSRVPLSKNSGKFWKKIKMSDQSIHLGSKHCRRMLGRHESSSRGNLKMNLHIGGFFARFLILAQQYTSAKTQPIPSKFGLFTFLLRKLQQKFNLFSSFKTNQQIRSFRHMLVELH